MIVHQWPPPTGVRSLFLGNRYVFTRLSVENRERWVATLTLELRNYEPSLEPLHYHTSMSYTHWAVPIQAYFCYMVLDKAGV